MAPPGEPRRLCVPAGRASIARALPALPRDRWAAGGLQPPARTPPARPGPQHREPGQWAGQRRARAGGAGGLGGLGTRLGVGVRGGGLEIRRGLGAAETWRWGLRGGRGLGESGEAACAPRPTAAPESQAAPSPWPRGSCREQVWGVLKAGVRDAIPFGSKATWALTAINTNTAAWGGGGRDRREPGGPKKRGGG